tara:strand:+ start:66 stop:722 length:657 start_codon:yes stop_codon:yes gene_type:complete
MPRKAIDYSKALIYKIVCKDLTITEKYYGSTTNFKNRKSHHKSNCININSSASNFPIYQFIRINGGWENWNMILEKEYPCENKLQLEREERLCMENDNNRLNKALPTQSKQEYYDNNKDEILLQMKEYYQNNKDVILEYHKEYYEINKDKILEYQNEYRENNKNKISEYHKEYRENNKDKISEKTKEKIECECGSIFRKGEISRHKKSKKHQKYLESI